VLLLNECLLLFISLRLSPVNFGNTLVYQICMTSRLLTEFVGTFMFCLHIKFHTLSSIQWLISYHHQIERYTQISSERSPCSCFTFRINTAWQNLWRHCRSHLTSSHGSHVGFIDGGKLQIENMHQAVIWFMLLKGHSEATKWGQRVNLYQYSLHKMLPFTCEMQVKRLWIRAAPDTTGHWCHMFPTSTAILMTQ
jgi:hypothetical protein